jgi:hypothetical protein
MFVTSACVVFDTSQAAAQPASFAQSSVQLKSSEQPGESWHALASFGHELSPQEKQSSRSTPPPPEPGPTHSLSLLQRRPSSQVPLP